MCICVRAVTHAGSRELHATRELASSPQDDLAVRGLKKKCKRQVSLQKDPKHPFAQTSYGYFIFNTHSALQVSQPLMTPHHHQDRQRRRQRHR